MAILVICAIGLMEHFKTKNIHSNLCYYTFLSNAAVFLYYLYSLIEQVILHKEFAPYRNVICGGVTPAIFITFLIFHFILFPEKKKKLNDYRLNKMDITAHYAVPIFTVLDYIIFVQKGTLKFSYIKIYLAVVFMYITYVYVHAILGLMIDAYPTKKRFPYFFLDYQTLGPIKAMAWFLSLFIFISLFFTFFIFLDNKVFAK